LHNFNTSLVHGAKLKYRFVGPSTKYAHLKGIQISAEKATIKVSLIKDVTITGNGTIIDNAIQNLNHNSSNLTESSVYNNTVTYSGGTVWCNTVVHGNSTNQSSSSGQFIQLDFLEYVTKSEGENYIIEIENIDESENTAYNINLNMFFYEEARGLI